MEVHENVLETFCKIREHAHFCNIQISKPSEFSLLKIRRYYEQTLEELKERHIREVESIKAQQRVEFGRDGTHVHSRFLTSNRYGSCENDHNGMDAQRYVVNNNY